MKAFIRLTFILTGVGALSGSLILHKLLSPHLYMHQAIADYWPLMVAGSAIAIIGSIL